MDMLDQSNREIEIEFDLTGTCQQTIRILKPEYDEKRIIDGLRDGSLLTTTWFNMEESLSYIDELATGEPVGVIISQKIYGDYFDFDVP